MKTIQKGESAVLNIRFIQDETSQQSIVIMMSYLRLLNMCECIWVYVLIICYNCSLKHGKNTQKTIIHSIQLLITCPVLISKGVQWDRTPVPSSSVWKIALNPEISYTRTFSRRTRTQSRWITVQRDNHHNVSAKWNAKMDLLQNSQANLKPISNCEGKPYTSQSVGIIP